MDTHLREPISEPADPAPHRLSPTAMRDFGARYRATRRVTERLCEPLSAEDCTVQSMRDASPAKWHLAHTTWFFETFVLDNGVKGYRTFAPHFRVLFNSYYHTVGRRHPRPERGMLTRPGLEGVLAYRRHVDQHMLALLEQAHIPQALAEARGAGSAARAAAPGAHPDRHQAPAVL